MNVTKNWFFEKINKIDKHIARTPRPCQPLGSEEKGGKKKERKKK